MVRRMLSIIITWRNRPEIEPAFPSFIEAAERVGGSIHIVNFGGDRAQLAGQLGDQASKVDLVHVDDAPWFNKAQANNIGAARASGDLLFFCDCDIILNEEVDALFSRVESGEETFGTVAGVRESRPNARAAANLVFFGYSLH